MYEFLGSRSGAGEISVHLGCDAASLGDRCVTFRYDVMVSSSRVEVGKNWTFWFLKMRLLRYLVTSGGSHTVTWLHIREETRLYETVVLYELACCVYRSSVSSKLITNL